MLPDPTGLHQLRMWYTAGWWNPVIRMAYSDDSGVTWTRDGGTLVGQGSGGVSTDVAHTGMWLDGPTLHLSFTDPDSGATTLRRVTSTDGGLTWGSPVTILTPTGWETGRWGNSACVKKAGVWHLLYECMDGSSVWQTGYATSTDGVTFTRQNGGNPLASLRVGTGMYGGLDLHLQSDGTWELFYHASSSGNLPTDIYQATSSDLINWTRGMILTRTLAFEFDQVADPHVINVGGQRMMIYSGVDNPNETSKFGRAIFVPS